MGLLVLLGTFFPLLFPVFPLGTEGDTRTHTCTPPVWALRLQGTPACPRRAAATSVHTCLIPGQGQGPDLRGQGAPGTTKPCRETLGHVPRPGRRPHEILGEPGARGPLIGLNVEREPDPQAQAVGGHPGVRPRAGRAVSMSPRAGDARKTVSLSPSTQGDLLEEEGRAVPFFLNLCLMDGGSGRSQASWCCEELLTLIT